GRLTDDGLVGRARVFGDRLQDALNDAFADHPNVGDIRGRGLFRGLEFVQDRASKTPFDPEIGLAARLKAAAFQAGLICYPVAGTVDGKSGDHVLLAPPLIIEDAQIQELVGKLSHALETVLTSLE
ncbi:MAG: aminotransferase class III-fold pyridoxal phosphate-dependent enzyme, partial [Paracoccaceae bacterium]